VKIGGLFFKEFMKFKINDIIADEFGKGDKYKVTNITNLTYQVEGFENSTNKNEMNHQKVEEICELIIPAEVIDSPLFLAMNEK
jgi:hypothetical protein